MGGGFINGTAEEVARAGLVWTLAPLGIFIGLNLGKKVAPLGISIGLNLGKTVALLGIFISLNLGQ